MHLTHQTSLPELISGCMNGNRRTQEVVYNLFSSKMMGVCLRYASSREEAEDLLQTGFIKVFEKISSFKSEGSFEGWIRRIMVNNCLENYRKSLRMLPVVDIETTREQADSSFELKNLEVKDLLKLIQALSPGYRLVFNMYAIEGYSHKEIAEELNISEGTSKSQLARARQVLQQQISVLEGINYASTKK